MTREIGARLFRVPSDRAFGFYSKENEEPLELLNRGVMGSRSYLSIRQAVDVASSYNSEKRWVQPLEMDFEAGITEIILCSFYG